MIILNKVVPNTLSLILCMERFSLIIDKQIDDRYSNGLKASNDGTFFSYLFLAYDIELPSKANDQNYETIMDTLNKFCSASGKLINFEE